MHHLTLIAATFWLAENTNAAEAEQYIPVKSALRARLGDDIFTQLSKIVDHLFNKHIRRAVILPQQQCFPEGCMEIRDFRIVAHRPPLYVLVQPTSPNLLTLKISDFDFYIAGSLYGNLHPIPLLPVFVPAFGTLAIAANQLSLGATFDIQKTIEEIPFIRVTACSLQRDIVMAHVENMGLLTDIVNVKYGIDITTKAREVLQSALCANVHRVVAEELNSRLAQLPRTISLYTLYKMIFEDTAIQKHVQKRELQSTVLTRNLPQNTKWNFMLPPPLWVPLHLSTPVNTTPKWLASSSNILNVIPEPIPTFNRLISQHSNFNIEKLAVLMLSLNLLDTSATYDKFFVGLDGDVYLSRHDRVKNPYARPELLRFTQRSSSKASDILISEYTVNTLLLKAHSVGALFLTVGSHTPVLGKLLRTSCTMDEVCLSDSIPEASDLYANKQLEVVIRSTEAPRVHVLFGIATIQTKGIAVFYVENTKEKVGFIPFIVSIQCTVTTQNGKLVGSMYVTSLDFDNNLNFFNLSLNSLGGFKEAAKGAISNLINSKLKDGLEFRTAVTSRFSNVSLNFVDSALRLQSDIDIERDFY